MGGGGGKRFKLFPTLHEENQHGQNESVTLYGHTSLAYFNMAVAVTATRSRLHGAA